MVAEMATPFIKGLRIALWGLVAVVAVGAGAIYLNGSQATTTSEVAIGAGTWSLVDDKGATVDQTMLQGHPSLLFFGFTHCPDVCPTTLGEMAVWFEELGAEADPLKAYFVTIDPERDGPQIMADYVGWLDGRVTGITGTTEEIDKIAKAWRAYYERVPTDDGSYTMNHTASVFLVNAEGEFEGTIAYQEDPATAVGKIRKLLGKA